MLIAGPRPEPGTKPSLGGTTSTHRRRRGRLPARLICASPNTHPRRDVMSTFITARAAGPRAKVALLALGGLAGIMAAGFSNAASPDSNVPRLVVQYSQSSLATAAG